jgi:hypothetical protein
MATFPTLFGEASTGKTKQWSVCVVEEDGCGVIRVEHGYEGGKLQVLQKAIREGKNLGRKNATTAVEQALSEARAAWVKKKESGYAERNVALLADEEEKKQDGGGVRGGGIRGGGLGGQAVSLGKGQDASVPTVMLAHDYHKRGKDIQYPCFVQRKLDGTRCVAVPGKGLFSRNKKRYPHLEHILEEIQRLPESIQLDGELYSATLTFQEIVGLVKRETLQPGDAEKQRQIQFHVYDIVSDKSYRERYMNLQYLFRRHRFQHLVLVPTEGCASEEEMKEKHAVYVADGYEGVMLRNKEGLYRGTRCVDLQKYKEFLDGEYEVVGWEEGQGLEEGCVLWICQTAQGKRFSCRPRGTREDRQALFRDGGTYVGRWLTVRYQEETDDGLPRFPVGIAFREYE